MHEVGDNELPQNHYSIWEQGNMLVYICRHEFKTWVDKNNSFRLESMVICWLTHITHRGSNFLKIKVNDHGQIDIHLWIFNSFERSVSYILRGSSVLRPKEWHHLCIGIDGESNTVYSNLVITRFMRHSIGVVALAASKRHALSKWHAQQK